MADHIPLRKICHARAGDKGDSANVGLIVFDQAHYAWIKEHVTAGAVEEYLKAVPVGVVERYELPKIGALNFLIADALDGGGSRTRKIDGHGKGYSAILLEMEIEAPPGFEAASEEAREL